VSRLSVGIQRDEFGSDIAAERQPDLRGVPGFWQVRGGSFWVALSGDRVLAPARVPDHGGRLEFLQRRIE
jgi:hypothetical protein